MKRILADAANSLLRPLGIGIAKEGFDMHGAVMRLGRSAPGVASVVDIGASNGRWSEIALKAFPRARVVGIDPLAEREAELKALKLSEPRFDYVLCAAGPEADGIVELAVGDDIDGSTVGGGEGQVRKVPTASIDAIAERLALQGPFLLKFDTHGFELPILAGASHTLERTSHIIMEVYNFRHTAGTLLFHEMCAHMEKLGFRCFNMAEPMHRLTDQALWQMDLFFARTDDPVFASDNYR
jgi:FkbM family methyltransferase